MGILSPGGGGIRSGKCRATHGGALGSCESRRCQGNTAILEFTTLRSINSSIELQILTSDGSKQHLLE